ncbi:hypothetical protein [Nannocystis pusilla]
MMSESIFNKAAGSKDLHNKLRNAKNSDELLKHAQDAGLGDDENTLAANARSIATAELRKHGLPEWAIRSLFLGEPVCW